MMKGAVIKRKCYFVFLACVCLLISSKSIAGHGEKGAGLAKAVRKYNPTIKLTGELLVRFKPDINTKQRSIIFSKYGMVMNRKNDALNIWVGSFSCASDVKKTMGFLRREKKSILSVSENAYISLYGGIIPNDLYYQYQWNLQQINAPCAWEITKGDPGVKIAVVDSGVRRSHIDINDKLVNGVNIISRCPNGCLCRFPYTPVCDVTVPNDDLSCIGFANGHGSIVAGIAAAETDDDFPDSSAIPPGGIARGMAGVGWKSSIMPVKIVDCNGDSDVMYLISGITYAADNGARIINLSLGVNFEPYELLLAIQYAKNKNCVIVAATGNDNYWNVGIPARWAGEGDIPDNWGGYAHYRDEVLSVGASDVADLRCDFSNYGPNPDSVSVVAPGIGLTGPSNTGDDVYIQFTDGHGTSFAAPQVSGLASLLIAVNPDLSVTNYYDIIRKTADPITTEPLEVGVVQPIPNKYTGYGRINACNAFKPLPPNTVWAVPTNDDIFIKWLLPAARLRPIASFNVYRAEDSNGPFILIGSVPYDPNNEEQVFDDSNTECSKKYFYYVSSIDSNGVEGKESMHVSALRPLMLSAYAGYEAIIIGGGCPITAKCLDADGKPIVNADVVFSTMDGLCVTGNTSGATVSGKTLADGTITATLLVSSSSSPGNKTVTVKVGCVSTIANIIAVDSATLYFKDIRLDCLPVKQSIYDHLDIPTKEKMPLDALLYGNYGSQEYPIGGATIGIQLIQAPIGYSGDASIPILEKTNAKGHSHTWGFISGDAYGLYLLRFIHSSGASRDVTINAISTYPMFGKNYHNTRVQDYEIVIPPLHQIWKYDSGAPITESPTVSVHTVIDQSTRIPYPVSVGINNTNRDAAFLNKDGSIELLWPGYALAGHASSAFIGDYYWFEQYIPCKLRCDNYSGGDCTCFSQGYGTHYLTLDFVAGVGTLPPPWGAVPFWNQTSGVIGKNGSSAAYMKDIPPLINLNYDNYTDESVVAVSCVRNMIRSTLHRNLRGVSCVGWSGGNIPQDNIFCFGNCPSGIAMNDNESTPALWENGYVFVGDEQGRIWALDLYESWHQATKLSSDSDNPENGIIAWVFQTGGPIKSSPAVIRNVNGLPVVYVGSNDGILYALYALSGVKKWGFNVKAPIKSSPAVINWKGETLIIVGCDDGNVLALNDTIRGVRLKWRRFIGGQIISSPTIANGYIYIGSKNGKLYSISLDTGIIAGAHQTNGPITSSAAISNGNVYIGSEDGYLYAFGPGVNCPTAVTSLKQGQNVFLSWISAKDATYPIDGYRVMRSENDTGVFNIIRTLSRKDTSYLDTTVVGGNKYTYIVDAFDTEGTYSENCGEVSIYLPVCTGGLAIVGPTVDMLATPCTGDVIFIEMKVTNNWCATLYNVIPSIVDVTGNQMIPGSIIPKLGVNISTIPSLAVGETATIFWGSMLRKRGNLVAQWKVSATGYDSLNGMVITGSALGNTIYASVGGGSMDVGAPQLITPQYSCVGEPFRMEFTVTNNGCETILGIDPTISATPPIDLVSGLVCTPSWASLHPGKSCTFVFSGTVSKAGVANPLWKVDVTGTGQNSNNVITASNSSIYWVLSFREPAFTVSAPYFATPTNTCMGMPVNVVMKVVNLRCHAINNLSPTITDLLKKEPGNMIGSFAIVKPAPASIPANGTAFFTWAGTIQKIFSEGVKWEGSVWGNEDQTGKLIWAGNTAGIVILSSMTPTLYVESLVFDWSGNHCVGDPVSVIMKVTNHRCRDVVDLAPSLQDMKGNEPGGIIDLQLVAPAPTTVPAGGSVSFTWAGTITKSGSETVKWRGSVTGKEDQTGIPQSGKYELPMKTIGVGAVLDASLSWQRGLKDGVPFDVVLTIRNTNIDGSMPGIEVTFAGISVDKEIPADGSDLPNYFVLSWLTPPSTTVSFILPPGGSQSFTWKAIGLKPGLAFLKAVVRGVWDVSCGNTPVEFSTDSEANVVSIHYDNGDWPMWGHDAQHTFNQSLSANMNPPLELKWSAPDGICPVIYEDFCYWFESNQNSGGSRSVLTARRVIDGAVAWRRALTSPYIACGGGMVFAEDHNNIDCLDAVTGNLITTIGGIQYPLSALTVDSGTLFVAMIGGDQNQWPYTTTNGKVMAYHIGGKSISPLYTTDTGYILVSTPPLVVAGKVYVASSGMIIALDAVTGQLLWPKSFPAGFIIFPDARNSNSPSGLSWDGNNIIMMGRMLGRNTNWAIALSPATGDVVWGRNYDGTELFDPATGFGKIGLFRRQPNAGNIFTSAVISPGNGDILLDSYPMLWVDNYPARGLQGKSMISNGSIYHNARNTAFTGVNALYEYPTIYNVFDYPGAEQKKPVWTPSTWGAGTPAIAHGMMFADGGYVYGPRTIDPPVLNVTKGRYKATLDWTDANIVKDISPDYIVKYELFRSKKEGLIWANGFENPSNAPFITKIGDFQPWAGSYTDEGLDACPDYFYAIRAVTQNGRKSWYSNEIKMRVGGICVTVFDVHTLYPYPCTVSSDCATTNISKKIFAQMVYGTVGDSDYPVEYRLIAPNLEMTGVYWHSSPPPPSIYGPNFLGSAAGKVQPCSCCTFVNQKRQPHCSESVPGTACIEVRVFIPSTGTYDYRTACGSGYDITSCSYNKLGWMGSPIPSGASCTGVSNLPVALFCEHLHPEGIYSDTNDFVYVVDTLKNRVQRFDAKGDWLSDIGPEKDKTIEKPSACTVSGDGTIFVTDSINSKVVKFNEDGEVVGQFGQHGNANGEFNQPEGIAIDATGGIWISDSLNSRLELFDPSGVFIRTIGKEGNGPGELKSPQQIALDSDGNIWVADSGNNRVQKLSPDGVALLAIGTGNGEQDSLMQPEGIAIDNANKLVYISNTINNSVEVFSAYGYHVSRVGSRGGELGEFMHSQGLALDTTNNYLYVADTLNNRGQKFTVMGQQPPDVIMPRAEIFVMDNMVEAIGSRLEIKGRAVDAYFKHYVISIMDSSGTTMLVDSDKPVWKGILGVWDTLEYNPGKYTIRLIVEDDYGNVSEDSMTVFLFNAFESIAESVLPNIRSYDDMGGFSSGLMNTRMMAPKARSLLGHSGFDSNINEQ